MDWDTARIASRTCAVSCAGSWEFCCARCTAPKAARKRLWDASPFTPWTAAISIVAEAHQFLRAGEVITDHPLRLILDRRPFI